MTDPLLPKTTPLGDVATNGELSQSLSFSQLGTEICRFIKDLVHLRLSLRNSSHPIPSGFPHKMSMLLVATSTDTNSWLATALQSSLSLCLSHQHGTDTTTSECYCRLRNQNSCSRKRLSGSSGGGPRSRPPISSVGLYYTRRLPNIRDVSLSEASSRSSPTRLPTSQMNSSSRRQNRSIVSMLIVSRLALFERPSLV